jgi:hypothetical protein
VSSAYITINTVLSKQQFLPYQEQNGLHYKHLINHHMTWQGAKLSEYFQSNVGVRQDEKFVPCAFFTFSE